jgi:hypothetical protein
LGQDGAFFGGCGSLSFIGRLPGLPSNTLMAVGVGFRPLIAILEIKTPFPGKTKRASVV